MKSQASLLLHYQPIVDMTLVSWRVLRRSCVSFNRWLDSDLPVRGQQEIEGQPELLKALIRTILVSIQRDMVPLSAPQHFYVSVNIPPIILGSGEVLAIVEELKLTPYLSRIACEVTERQALTSIGRAALARARQAGMSVAIDDFGTGHSGLMQIVGLNFDILRSTIH